jgi:hypothetical protein
LCVGRARWQQAEPHQHEHAQPSVQQAWGLAWRVVGAHGWYEG